MCAAMNSRIRVPNFVLRALWLISTRPLSSFCFPNGGARDPSLGRSFRYTGTLQVGMTHSAVPEVSSFTTACHPCRSDTTHGQPCVHCNRPRPFDAAEAEA